MSVRVASFAWTTDIMLAIVWIISESMSSSGGNGMLKSVGFRDDDSGGGVVEIDGKDRNVEGVLGKHIPVGVPIVVVTESQPNVSRMRTPSLVPEIKPNTKYAVLR
jgi:hypothetical protein